MKVKLLCVALLAAFSVGCQQSKVKACEGCTGVEHEDCEFDYEDCANDTSCRLSDIGRIYADGVCLPAVEALQ